jgi:DNA-binding winged helix-turn-helix (wHTH) protein
MCSRERVQLQLVQAAMRVARDDPQVLATAGWLIGKLLPADYYLSRPEKGLGLGETRTMIEVPEETSRRAVMTYCFEGFVFDPTCGVISQPHGTQIRLRSQSAEVLQYLLDRAQQVVSRDELLQAIWPDVTVTEQSLTQCVSDIRRGLGAQGSELLRTLAKRGYILSTDVRREAAPIASVAAPASAGEPAGQPSAERRQVTVLFCEAIEQSVPATDPEDLRDALTAYHRALGGIGERYGAHFIQYPGSSAALCFGWPSP